MTTRYFRPAGFVDSPIGYGEGRVLRLAGGMQFFSAWDVIEVANDERTARSLVAADALQPRDEREAALIAAATTARAPLTLGERVVRLDQPQVMGILNVTPDSFSDGGKHDDPEAAIGQGVDMVAAGAAIIDVGGESTRPNAQPVWEGDEIKRTQPVVERLMRGGNAVSIDTRKASVMEAAIASGAQMVNDVSALGFDAQALALMARSEHPVVLMHAPDPRDLHAGPEPRDPLIAVFDWFVARIAAVEAAGVARRRLMLDPGIGFGKGVAANLALINGLSLFHTLGCPIVLGASRKRFIGALAGEAPAEQRLPGSLAIALKGAEQGAQIIRAHDVAETVQALKIWRGLRDQGLAG